MRQNILRASDVTKIYLSYMENGLKRKFTAKLRFMDLKECYFSAPLPLRFNKPRRRVPVDITVYTLDGVYSCQVTILDTMVSLDDVMFSVSVPKTWKFMQLRKSTRKEVNLPFSIKFNDDFEVFGETHDLSLGGFAYTTEKQIPSIYEKLNTVVSITFPDTLFINFPNKKLVTYAKFVRKKEKHGEYGELGTLYAFRFLKLSPDEEDILKTFVLGLD